MPSISQLSYTLSTPSSPSTSSSALIFVHGWACQKSDFSPLVQHLLSRTPPPPYRILTLDLPGSGSSPSSLCPSPTIALFATHVLSLARELSLDTLVLAGHSMGVRIVLECFHQNLSSLSFHIPGVIFLDGSHYKLREALFPFDVAGSKGDGHARKGEEGNKQEGKGEGGGEERVKMKLKAFGEMFGPATPEEFRSEALAHVRGTDQAYGEEIRRSHIRFDLEEMDGVLEDVGKGEVELLNLQSTDVEGGNRRVRLKEGAETRWMRHLWEKVPRVQQRVVVGAGHFPHVDCVEVVAREIGGFMESLGVGKGGERGG